MSNSPDPHIEKISNLHAFLAREKLEVVRAVWGPNYAYPVLYVRPATPPVVDTCAHCGHLEVLHDAHKGECLVAGCPCEVYCEPLSEGEDE